MPTVSSLTAATTPLAGTETVYLVQGGSSRRATVDDVRRGPVNNGVTLAGTSISLGAMPSDARDIDILLNSATFAAGSDINLQFIGATGHQFFVTRALSINASSSAVGGQLGDSFMRLDSDAASQALTGVISLRRFDTSWGITGTLRTSATRMITYSGVCNFGSNTFAGVALFSSANFAAGNAVVKWRV